jgi:hypothetical protein
MEEEYGEENILQQEEGRRGAHGVGMGPRRELHRLLRRGRHQHRRQQRASLTQRRPKRKRYTLEIPPNILLPMMRVALVMIMMI